MKLFLMILALSSTAVFAAEEPPFKLARYFKLKTCTKEGKCTDFVARERDAKYVNMKLTQGFSKGMDGGHDGWDRARFVKNGTPFQTEIHVIKYPAGNYYIYAMLRSGRGTKRGGKVLKLHLKDLSELKDTELTDEPIAFKGGTMQAQLVIGPQE